MRPGVRKLTKYILMAGLALGPACVSHAQDENDQAPGRGQFAGMQRVMGEVTAVNADKVTVKSEDGAVYQVVTTPNTRMMKSGGATFKLAELKPGDGVMSSGNLDAPNKTMHAAMLIMVDAEQVKKMTAARQQMMANLGKTLIMGRVTALDVDNLKMTVERPDHVSQVITFDEGTSFRRGAPGSIGANEANSMGLGGWSGRQGGAPASTSAADTGESITLADVKVGDNVNGPGAIKNGVFVPAQLVVRTPRAGGRRRGQGAPGGASAPGGNPVPQGTDPGAK